MVGYSRIYPDYRTTFRGISGFYKAGEERKCGGAYCTTWEFMHGALIENSWYGLIYSAECAWNPESTPKTEFNRRFADEFLGLRDPAAADQIEKRQKLLEKQDPFQILGIAKTTDRDGLRTAYKALARMYHPDRFAGSDLPPEVEEYINTMARRINAAYSELIGLFGGEAT